MALDKAQLKTDLITALTTAKSKTDDPAAAFDAFAGALADAIDNYVKAGEVNYVSASLNAPSGGGPVTTLLPHMGTIH